ncbi:MAG: hypothetical protein QM488_07500 [Rhizobiaceae bacterium]
MSYTLSLNTNPLVNHFAEIKDPVDTIAHDLKIRDIQLTHEFINPSWPASLVRRLTREMQGAQRRTVVQVTFGMTGPYGRLNRFGHPDPDVRRYYVDWFKINEICLELSFKEREPNDCEVIPQIAESIAFWAPHIDTGINDLNI